MSDISSGGPSVKVGENKWVGCVSQTYKCELGADWVMARCDDVT